eukprot:3395481-Amphidinium_carterae.1
MSSSCWSVKWICLLALFLIPPHEVAFRIKQCNCQNAGNLGLCAIFGAGVSQCQQKQEGVTDAITEGSQSVLQNERERGERSS